jgi:hypothetical protein
MRLVGLLLALGLCLAACSSGPPAKKAAVKHGTTTTTTAPVPVSTTSSTVPGTPAPPCQGSALAGTEVSFGTAKGEAATVIVALTNTTKAACSLTGYPKLQLLDAKGNTLATTVQNGGSGIPTTLTANTANLGGKGGQASFMLYWSPVPTQSDPTCPLAPKMTVSVPGSSKTVSMAAEINACGGIIQASPFQLGVIPAVTT